MQEKLVYSLVNCYQWLRHYKIVGIYLISCLCELRVFLFTFSSGKEYIVKKISLKAGQLSKLCYKCFYLTCSIPVQPRQHRSIQTWTLVPLECSLQVPCSINITNLIQTISMQDDVCLFVCMLPISSAGTAGPIWLNFFLLAPSWSRDGFRPKKFQIQDLKNFDFRVLFD